MQKITPLELLKHGAHFGHQVSRWHPKMKPYIFNVRNGIHIIDLEKTLSELEKALAYMQSVAAKGGTILFVGTKRQAEDIVKKTALACGMPYVNKRWLGGMLTNFPVIVKMLRKYKDLIAKRESGKLAKYTKKEQLEFSREIERLEASVGGIANLEKIPDAVFIIDLKREKTAFSEALTRKVPVIALCDTNVDPSGVDYVIPANDDATRAISYFCQLFSDAINEAKAKK